MIDAPRSIRAKTTARATLVMPIRFGLIATCAALELAACTPTAAHPNHTPLTSPITTAPATPTPANSSTPVPYVYPTSPRPPANSIDGLTMFTADTGWAQRIWTAPFSTRPAECTIGWLPPRNSLSDSRSWPSHSSTLIAPESSLPVASRPMQTHQR